MKKHLVAGLALLTLLLAGCRADQMTKAWAMDEIKESPRTVVPGLLELRYAENHAIAFSLLHDVPARIRTPLIYALAAGAMAALLAVAWSRRRHGPWSLAPFSLIMAGAFGNILDRMTHGFVIDFVRLHWRDAWSWPIFNLADSLISVGMALMLWQSFRDRDSTATENPETAPAG